MIVIDVEWLRPMFHGLRGDGSVDWPPSPVRLLGALISGAYSLPESADQVAALEAVTAISAAPQPEILVPESIDLEIPDTFTEGTWAPEGKTAAGELKKLLDLSQVDMDTKSRDAKPQGAVALSRPTMTYGIDVSLSRAQVEGLSSAARLIPYFGRSNDPAVVSVHQEPAESLSVGVNRRRLIPVSSPQSPTRGWTAETIAWFDANYERTFSEAAEIKAIPLSLPGGAVQQVQYVRARSSIENADSILFERSVANWGVPRLIRAVRESVGSEVSQRWSITPLTLSGSLSADGRCVGVRLAAHDFEVDPLTGEILGGVVDGQESGRLIRAFDQIIGGSDFPVLGRVVNPKHTLDNSTWIGPARYWVSTTPLRAFPDERVLRNAIETECDRRFGQIPSIAIAVQDPWLSWQSRWGEQGITDGFGQWWVSLGFDDKITGPLVLGATTEWGFGVFRPLSDAEASL